MGAPKHIRLQCGPPKHVTSAVIKCQTASTWCCHTCTIARLPAWRAPTLHIASSGIASGCDCHDKEKFPAATRSVTNNMPMRGYAKTASAKQQMSRQVHGTCEGRSGSPNRPARKPEVAAATRRSTLRVMPTAPGGAARAEAAAGHSRDSRAS